MIIIIKYMHCYFYFYINFYYCFHKNVEEVDICAFLIVKFRHVIYVYINQYNLQHRGMLGLFEPYFLFSICSHLLYCVALTSRVFMP